MASLAQVLGWIALGVAYAGLIGHLLDLPRLLGPASNLPMALTLPAILVAMGFLVLGKEAVSLQGILLWMIVSSAAVMGVATLATARAVQRLDEERLARTRALAQSEARFRLILEGSRDPVLLLGRERTVQYANPATGTLLGANVKSLDITQLQAALQADSLPAWITLWKGLKAEGAFLEEPLDLTWVRKEGTLVPTRCRVANVRDADGAVTGMVLTLQPQRRSGDEG